MPVDDFSGDTFVAFTDISGFKEMMKYERKAIRALSILNQSGYDILQDNPAVNGFFVSDSGILFVRGSENSINDKFISVLKVLEKINRRLLEHDIMLTTSISFGQFSYHQRLEFPGIEKNPIYGNAYVSAFLDNETGTPKIQPGQCRLVFNSIKNSSEFDIYVVNRQVDNRLLKKGKHYYFYWMVNDFRDIREFEIRYNDTYKLKYQGMLTALKSNF